MKDFFRSIGPTFFLITGLFTVIGAGLRFEYLDQPFTDEYSWRETSTAMMARNFYQGNDNIFFPQLDWGGPGPNYQGREFQTLTYLTAQLYRIFGPREWVGRSVVVVFSLWAMFAFFLLLRRVWDPRRAAAATAVLALMPGAIFTERSFLPDPVMVSLLLTALWLLVTFARRRQLRFLLPAVLIGTLGVLTKLNGLILGLPAVYLLYAAARSRPFDRREWAALAGSAVFVAGCILGYYLWAKHLSETYPPYHFAGGGKFFSLDKLPYWLDERYFLPELALILPWMFGQAAMLLAVVGFILALPSRTDEAAATPQFPYFFHFWAIALVVQYAIEAQHLVDDPYNMHMYFPCVAAFAGATVVALTDVAPRPGLRTVVLAAVFGTLLFFGRQGSGYRFAHTESYHAYAIGRELDTLAEPNELAVVFGGNPLALYYARRRGWTHIPFADYAPGNRMPDDRTDVAEFRRYWREGADYVVIPAYDELLGPLPRTRLESAYPEIEAFLFDNFSVIHEGEHGIILRVPEALR